MAYLLDTHVFLWLLGDDKRLKGEVREILTTGNNIIFLSVAVPWEISLKRSVGKLKFTGNITTYVKKSGFEVLPIQLKHVAHLRKLKDIHKDPFDRIMLCQAFIENLIFITADAKLKQYSADILSV